MDFLEGFLLGPVWSDTEYETRRHTGFFWLIGWITAAVFFWLLLYPERYSQWLFVNLTSAIVLTVILFIATPFMSRFYYKVHFLLKIPMLFIQIAKFVLLLKISLHIGLARYQINRAEFPQQLLEHVNQTIENSTVYFETLGRGIGMLLGIIAGGLIIVSTIIGIVLLATLLPVIALLVFKTLQRLLDELIYRYIFHESE